MFRLPRHRTRNLRGRYQRSASRQRRRQKQTSRLLPKKTTNKLPWALLYVRRRKVALWALSNSESARTMIRSALWNNLEDSLWLRPLAMLNNHMSLFAIRGGSKCLSIQISVEMARKNSGSRIPDVKSRTNLVRAC